MGKYENKQKRPFGKLPILLLLVLLIAVLAVWQVPGLVARYTQEQSSQALLKAKEFYFTSDLLQPGGASYTLNPGTQSISFILRNHADTLRFSEVNVSYTVNVTGNATLDSTSGILSGTGNQSTKTVTLSGLKSGESYTVTATGTGGYSQTISATFTVAGQGSGVFKHTAESAEYILLTLWTEDTSGDVSITLPDHLIPDSTDSRLAGIQNFANGSYSGGTFSAGSLSGFESHTYRFFKTPDYSAAPITVTVGGVHAVETPLQ